MNDKDTLPTGKTHRDQNRINENIPRDPKRVEKEFLNLAGVPDDDDEEDDND